MNHSDPAAERNRWNAFRFRMQPARGHYESYFQRANHPSRPLAFWFRYTLFAPRGAHEEAEGELWALWFDGEREKTVSVYQSYPLQACRFDPEKLGVRIGDATLDDGGLAGSATSDGNSIAWRLGYRSDEPPLLLFPERLYAGAFPKAKVLVGSPHARYSGSVEVSGERHSIEEWPGSQNHNWGVKHTDLYAWAQVAGFDAAPDVFFEGSTARLKIAGISLPPLTPLVVRVEGRDYALNTPRHLLSSRGAFSDWHWEFRAADANISIEGHVSAPKSAFAALDYRNPPGGTKRCLNSKIARCELHLRFADGRERRLVSPHRAAFEVLGDPRALALRGFV